MITRKEIIKLTKPVITEILNEINLKKECNTAKYIANYNVTGDNIDISITRYALNKTNNTAVFCTIYPGITGIMYFTLWNMSIINELDKVSNIKSLFRNYMLLLGFTEND